MAIAGGRFTSMQISSWQAEILREFVPGLGRAIVVADPDGLLMTPQLSEALSERGFDLLLYEDPIAFRFAYETRYRTRFDRHQKCDVVVVWHGQKTSLSALPCDLLARSQKLFFSLTDLFPNFSYPVLSALQPDYLDTLFEAQTRLIHERLGDNATKDFVLKHILGITPDLITSDTDLLLTLLRLHYRPSVIPPVFLTRLIEVIGQVSRFEAWPLDLLFRNRSRFFLFLQERWPRFLGRARDGAAQELPSRMIVPGPQDIPFEDADVRAYINTLFLEGLLQPVAAEIPSQKEGDWFLIGVRHDPRADHIRRLSGLLELAEKELPSLEDRHDAWLAYAQNWGQVGMLVNQLADTIEPKLLSRFGSLQRQMDLVFASWLQRRFGALHNLPAEPPVLVHHLLRHLANLRSSGAISKVALLVIDGLAFDQWLALRDELSQTKCTLSFNQAAVFAWIPTITSVSRQAIFAGRAPQYFPSSIYSTDKEPRLFQTFWAEHGLSPGEVGYQKGLGELTSLQLVEEIASTPRLEVLGLVVDKVDRIMHGMEMGMRGMHNQVRQWAREGFLGSLFDLLMTNGYAVFLTSDHGNIEAVGCGRPNEGAIAEVRGERVRIYSDEHLRARVASRFLDAVPWITFGLPDDFLPLLAPDRQAFIADGLRTVAHGGTTLDEIIVPFVQIQSETQ